LPIGKTLLETIKREKGGLGSSKTLRSEPSPAGIVLKMVNEPAGVILE
jgi:hypothetical protein